MFVSDTDLSGRSFSNLRDDNSVWRLHHSGAAPSELRIPAGVNGRFVKVQLAGRNILSLAEVQVFATNSATTRSNAPIAEAEESVTNKPVEGEAPLSPTSVSMSESSTLNVTTLLMILTLIVVSVLGFVFFKRHDRLNQD